MSSPKADEAIQSPKDLNHHSEQSEAIHSPKKLKNIEVINTTKNNLKNLLPVPLKFLQDWLL